MSDLWFALVIGNSRYHWARFRGEVLEAHWDEDYQAAIAVSPPHWEDPAPVWIASVVPEQSRRWAAIPPTRFLTLADVPLAGLYPTLGIDRALAVWGAIATYGSPVLVIDAGTALTFTGATEHNTFAGGAILPGLRLQFAALGQGTAIGKAGREEGEGHNWPDFMPRWGMNTEAAIASGILYTVTAGIQGFIQDWWRQCPGSAVVLTGGDSLYLYRWLQREQPDLANLIQINECLIFQGIRIVRLATP